MNYYNRTRARLVTLTGDNEEDLLGIWPLIAKAAVGIGKFAVGGIGKRIRRKRAKRKKRKAAAKRKKALVIRRKREAESLKTLMIMQAQRKVERKQKKQKQLLNIAIPAAGVGAAMLLMGKE